MLVVPATVLSAAATLMAVILLIFTFWQAARMRGRHGILAPAMTGHPIFERAIRVQMNTLEQVVIFLPLLWLATIYFRLYGWLPAALGVVWVVGRILYSIAYMADPEKRHIGFTISALASLALLILSAIGIVETWMVVTAT